MKYQNISPHDLFLSVNGKSRVIRAGEIVDAVSIDHCPQIKTLSQEKVVKKPIVSKPPVVESVEDKVSTQKKRKRTNKTRKVDANT